MTIDARDRAFYSLLLLAAAVVCGVLGWLAMNIVTAVMLLASPVMIAAALTLQHDRSRLLGALAAVGDIVGWPALFMLT